MKIRSGFVSNSSTSSFIIKGFVVDKDKIDYDKFVELFLEKYPDIKESLEKYDEDERYYELQWEVHRHGFYFANDEESGAPCGSNIFGELIQDTGSEGYIKDQIIDCNYDDKLLELQSMLKEVSEEEPKIKIIVGTRCC